VALDLDGTLLDGPALPAPHAAAVRWLRQQSIQVALVTGRSVLTARRYWDALGLDTPLVCFNGAFVGIPGGATIAERPLAPQDVATVLRVLRPFGGCISVFPDCTQWVVDTLTDRCQHFPAFYDVPISADPTIHERWEGSTCKILFDCDPSRIPAAQTAVVEACGATVHVVRSMPDKLEIMQAGVDKAWGLERLAAHLTIDRTEIWAVGDERNDLEMLAWVAVGCAMGQAPAEVKARARFVLPSVHDCGLTALRDILP